MVGFDILAVSLDGFTALNLSLLVCKTGRLAVPALLGSLERKMKSSVEESRVPAQRWCPANVSFLLLS